MDGFTAKYIRQSCGLTQGATASLLGVAQTTVSNWERGESTIPDWHAEFLNFFSVINADRPGVVAVAASKVETFGAVHAFWFLFAEEEKNRIGE